jgi:molybdopterin-binding protein
LLETVTGGAGGGGTRLTDAALGLLHAWQRCRPNTRLRARPGSAPGRLPALHGLMRRMSMKTTARNQFAGNVSALDVGPVSAQVTIALKAGGEITATLTSAAAKRLKLAKGKEALALIKASAVVLVTDFAGWQLSARNQLAGTVSRIERGAVSSLVVLTLPGGGGGHRQRHQRRRRGAGLKPSASGHGGVQGLFGDGGARSLAFRAEGLPAAHELAGLAVGVYTGGTPNLAAIKTALGIDETRFLVFNAFDTLVGAAYLMFMLTLAPRLAMRWLRPQQDTAAVDAAASDASMHDEDYRELLTRAGLGAAARSLGVAVLVVGAAVGLGQTMGGANATAITIALLATFGLLASLVPAVRALRLSYKTGMYRPGRCRRRGGRRRRG